MPTPLRTAKINWPSDCTILVVDDDECVREVVQTILEDQGCSVLTARDGRDAIEVFRRRGRDVSSVLLDMTMPGLDGEAVLTELRAIDPSAKVVLMSGDPQHPVARHLAGHDLTGFVEKPFLPATLMHALRELDLNTTRIPPVRLTVRHPGQAA